MCFISQSKNDKYRIAKRNKTVYKIGFKRSVIFLSEYQHYSYIRNLTQPSIMLLKLDRANVFSIEDGYHSYSNLKEATEMLHDKLKVGKFIIPKGTKYYIANGEIVSETIIFKGFIK